MWILLALIVWIEFLCVSSLIAQENKHFSLSPRLSLVETVYESRELALLLQSNSFPGLIVQKRGCDNLLGYSNLAELVHKTDEFDSSIRIPHSCQDVDSLVQTLLPASWNIDDAATFLKNDIAQLVNLMSLTLAQPTDSLTCRLNLMRQTRCPMWHEDYVDIRLIKTYCGVGTDYVDPSDVFVRLRNWIFGMGGENLSVPAQPASMHSARAGDTLVLSGRNRNMRFAVPVLHRSPNTEEPRLLFSVTLNH